MLDFETKRYRLFLATGSKAYLEYLMTCGAKQILISFAYADTFILKELMKRNDVKLLCDSGAFTSWNLAMRKKQEGDPNWKNFLVDIYKYIAFVKEHEDIIWRAVNLDVIPGEQGREPGFEEIEIAAQQGFDNLKIMQAHGINAIHVYHQGEDLKWLDKMIVEGACDYIGVSPCNDYSTERKQAWLDQVFRYLGEKYPHIKTHGFGVTAGVLVKRYPWYSTDSSSYSMTAAMGAILTPYGRIYVSDDPEGLGDPDHIDNKPQQIKDFIDKYLLARIGYNLKSMMDKDGKTSVQCTHCKEYHEILAKTQAYKPRNFANISYFLDLEDEVNSIDCPMNFSKQSTLQF